MASASRISWTALAAVAASQRQLRGPVTGRLRATPTHGRGARIAVLVLRRQDARAASTAWWSSPTRGRRHSAEVIRPGRCGGGEAGSRLRRSPLPVMRRSVLRRRRSSGAPGRLVRCDASLLALSSWSWRIGCRGRWMLQKFGECRPRAESFALRRQVAQVMRALAQTRSVTSCCSSVRPHHRGGPAPPAVARRSAPRLRRQHPGTGGAARP